MNTSNIINYLRVKTPRLRRFIRINFIYQIWKYKIFHKFLIYRIKRRKKVNVVFIASSLGMWRYQKIFDALNCDKRFNCSILISPMEAYKREEKENSIIALIEFFNKLNIPFKDGFHDYFKALEWIKDFNPDIIFYPQPYPRLFNNKFEERYYRKKLLCYVPYGVSTLSSVGLYNTPFQNIAWKLFYPTAFHQQDALKFADNRGDNVIVVGDPTLDIIRETTNRSPWKLQNKNKKKVIWAPHFSVKPSFCLNRASFLWLNEIMLQLAEEFKESIQFCFKPHPRLKTELYELSEWGKKKTDDYYEKWEKSENTQLEEGEYFDLFRTSDAMIHDCGSFSVEYLYTGHPVLFTSKNLEADITGLNELGKLCLEHHYIATCKNEVIEFLNNVLENKDLMKSSREKFFNDFLNPPSKFSVAETIKNTLIKEFNLV